MTGLDVLNPLRVLVRVLLFHVLLKRRVHGKGHVAYLAAVLVVARGAVSLHVAREFARLGACIIAQLTFVRPFTRVHSSVDSQVRRVFEDLSAELARVILGAARAPSPMLTGRCGRIGRRHW